MSKYKDLEARVSALEEVVDFLTQEEDFESTYEDLPDESKLLHQAYASRSAHPSVGDTNAFVAGYVARAKEEYGIYAP